MMTRRESIGAAVGLGVGSTPTVAKVAPGVPPVGAVEMSARLDAADVARRRRELWVEVYTGRLWERGPDGEINMPPGATGEDRLRRAVEFADAALAAFDRQFLPSTK